MTCCRKKDEENVRTTITLLRRELLYDIENYAFVEGDIIAEETHGKHQVFDIVQEGNEDLVTRMLNLAYAECVEALYPYTKSLCVADSSVDNSLVAPEQYVIEMTLPNTFSQSTVILLKEIMHKYFAARVLAEWLGITNPTSVERWQEKLEALRSQLKTSLLHRRKRLRVSQHLF